MFPSSLVIDLGFRRQTSQALWMLLAWIPVSMMLLGKNDLVWLGTPLAVVYHARVLSVKPSLGGKTKASC